MVSSRHTQLLRHARTLILKLRPWPLLASKDACDEGQSQVLLCLAYDTEVSGTSTLFPCLSLPPLNFNPSVSHLL